MKQECGLSHAEFEVTEPDRAYYRRLGVPAPRCCPEERLRRRLSFANQRTLYHRVCSGSGKRILSNYSPGQTVPVYDIEYWYSDAWDRHATGRPFDFSRPFFPQMKELLQVAPRPNLQRAPQFDENSDYTNYAGKNKNCYLIFDSDKNWDCLYSYSINSCRDVMDCFRAENCELCYECIDSTNCYSSHYLQDCDTCTQCSFLKSCIGCSDCFGCVNMKNKKYCFFNEQYSKDEYTAKVAALGLGRRSALEGLRAKFLEYAKQFPHRFMHGVHNEDVTGDYLTYSKNAKQCFDSRKLWDCSYVVQAFDSAKDCYDCTEVGDGAELLYESCYCGYNVYGLRFVSHALGGAAEQTYCYFCPTSTHLFGCVGLHHSHYCILNQQYSQAEFETLVPRIIEHMERTGEWGEFFPADLSPFPYNRSHAQEYLPLAKDQALARGYTWQDDDPKEYQPATLTLPDSIAGTEDVVTQALLQCARSGKNYKVQRRELELSRKLGVPLSSCCFDVRHADRLALRNPRVLYERKCARSGVSLLTTYAPERPEEILSEEEFVRCLE